MACYVAQDAWTCEACGRVSTGLSWKNAGKMCVCEWEEQEYCRVIEER